MPKKPGLKEVTLNWIRALPSGRIFKNEELYRLLEQDFLEDCAARGDTPRGPRYNNDARWAVHDAKNIGKIIKPAGRPGEFERL